MRDWVNELTGRDGSSSGIRIPSEAEISQVSAMFPNVGRETVVGALQRRYVWSFRFFPIMCHVLQSWTANLTLSVTEYTLGTFSPTTESAIETLLRTEN